MPHTKMNDAQFRDLVIQRLDDGDRRFSLLDEGQKTMRAQIKENTDITKHALGIAQGTESKVDRLIIDTGRIADERHKENVMRFDAMGMSVNRAADNAREAKESADKTQNAVAGLVGLYDGAKVVRGIAVGLKGIVLYLAALFVGASLITAAVLSMMGKGPVPALFGH